MTIKHTDKLLVWGYGANLNPQHVYNCNFMNLSSSKCQFLSQNVGSESKIKPTNAVLISHFPLQSFICHSQYT